MPYYEHVFIARQDINASQVETLISDFGKVIEDQGGKVAKSEYWGLKSLTYRIKKNRKGHYVLMNLDAPAAAVWEMERQARLHDDVLRFMTVRVDELEEGPSAVVRAKSEKDNKRGGGRRGQDR
ncbi:small subunit ribosomal protein S6 [Rhodothalassium salexigens DSM 2132]|uniref:Small ribosomal subunit protein bS6 n=1 Tax=Rhodothalassium salexigens DSM 2132 TaxID=1188247 RepID=A0A4R2PWB5_RHOSA|nr:30S ribosomal protein S6 [Rhodothalassium salexigens]MBB4210277.1 small subunit ribosomal protein S6 [Rhodothalassium salexigens DSM 2132]MBK1638797.1 30S ribosomal protein S6 [Rhodothalassium salexigens DSM 2132]MBK5920877.1 30S ribosomal protein S6 [Rhodothalassium salexigens]TCP38441.1 small subunit ribosomal protein S6 [Rhodothalassium salexigens DSM 2132]